MLSLRRENEGLFKLPVNATYKGIADPEMLLIQRAVDSAFGPVPVLSSSQQIHSALSFGIPHIYPDPAIYNTRDRGYTAVITRDAAGPQWVWRTDHTYLQPLNHKRSSSFLQMPPPAHGRGLFFSEQSRSKITAGREARLSEPLRSSPSEGHVFERRTA
jgi:hypothetical protein